MRFEDRRAAGRLLALELEGYRKTPGTLVLALPRGGVPVAYEVAKALDGELDVLVVRKLGVPQHPELAMGAIASGGAQVLNQDVIRAVQISPAAIEAVARNELAELERREHVYRGNRPRPKVEGRTVILVDDGLATGASMKAATIALRAQRPATIVVAVPVAPVEAAAEFSDLADDFVVVFTPPYFNAVGQWYQHFDQTTDEEVRRLLELSHTA